MESALSNEQKLVLLSSRLSQDIDKEELERFLSFDIAWEKVFEYASRNKVLFLMSENIRKCGYEEKLPKYFKLLVKDGLQCNVIRNTEKLKALEEVCKKLESEDIKIVPVKGAYLIDNVYGDRSVRTTNDMDALIKKKDIQKIDEVMKKLGYTSDKYDANTGQFKPRSVTEKMLYKTKMYNLLPYVKTIEVPLESQIEFDFSHALDFSLDIQPVEEMINNSFIEGGIRQLKPEHFFVHMCCHHYREASHTEWIRLGKDLNLIKFCDVRAFVMNKMDKRSMNAALKFAAKHKVERAVYFTLHFLEIIYNDGYERAVLQQLNIEDEDFIYLFGENEYVETKRRKKAFWNSFFDPDNTEELAEKTKYDELMK